MTKLITDLKQLAKTLAQLRKLSENLVILPLQWKSVMKRIKSSF